MSLKIRNQMKTIHLLILGVSIILCGGCASCPHPLYDTPPKASSFPAAKLLVISAVYGSGVQFADVTSRVDEMLHEPNVEFFARPEWLNADPTPGWNKALVIVYEWKGHRHIFTTGEGGKVSVGELVEHAK